MKNIGIVIPKVNNEIQTRYVFPVGLAYIKGALKASGYDVKAINLNHVKTIDLENVLKRWIIENKICVCLSGGIS